MPIPEPDYFALEDIAERWSDLLKKTISLEYLHGLSASGQLEIQEVLDSEVIGPSHHSESLDPSSSGFLSALSGPETKVTSRYFVIKEERDRFEKEHFESGAKNNVSPKTKGAYLKLIGYMAVRLADKDSLTMRSKEVRSLESLLARLAR